MASRSHSGGRSGPLGFISSLYDLDTLDTRFTTPSSVPYRVANDKREDDDKVADKRADPPKWKSLEFYLYYLVFLTVVPYMFWVAYDVSRRRSSLWNIVWWGRTGVDNGQHRIRDTIGLRTGLRMAGFRGARS
jgi:hypothetical protein